MINPRISIVIPAFNVAAYVRAAIESVLQQTVAPYEILVFDDGSTDETGTILAEYADHAWIRYFVQTNQGLGPTRNLGAQRAGGDYLYFFDADDVLDVQFIARMQQLIVENDAPNLIMFSGIGFTEHEELASFLTDYRRNGQAQVISGIEALPLLEINGWIDSSACLYLTKISFWRDHGFRFPSTLNEDEDVIVPLVVAAGTVLIKGDVLFYRRIRKGSITTGRRDLAYLRAMESNLYHAIQQISIVPITAKKARKLLRKRCRIVVTQYLEISSELRSPMNKRLLLRAALTTGNLRLFRKAFLTI